MYLKVNISNLGATLKTKCTQVNDCLIYCSFVGNSILKNNFFKDTQTYVFVKMQKYFGHTCRFYVKYSFNVDVKKPRNCLITKFLSLCLVFV